MGFFTAVAATGGVYTPTLFNTTNIDASTPNEARFHRVGDTVFVSGSLSVDPTSGGGGTAAELGISLPVASTVSAANKASGSLTGDSGDDNGLIVGDVANDRVNANWDATHVTNLPYKFEFSYEVE